MTEATRLISINSLLTKTGWESHEIRKKHKLIFFFKMKTNLCPEYLSSLIPANVGSSVCYSLRNANAIKTINAKTLVSSPWYDREDIAFSKGKEVVKLFSDMIIAVYPHHAPDIGCIHPFNSLSGSNYGGQRCALVIF